MEECARFVHESAETRQKYHGRSWPCGPVLRAHLRKKVIPLATADIRNTDVESWNLPLCGGWTLLRDADSAEFVELLDFGGGEGLGRGYWDWFVAVASLTAIWLGEA